MRKKEFLSSFTLAFTGILLLVSLLVVSASYFNNKEIETLTSQYFKRNGEPTLKIYNGLTNNYSFVCYKS